MKATRKIAVKDFELQRVQDNLIAPLNVLTSLAILDGVLVQDIDIAAAAQVEHGLGRKPIGYIVIRRSAASTISDTGMDVRNLNLAASAPVTISLWIF